MGLISRVSSRTYRLKIGNLISKMDAGDALQIDEGHTAERVYDSADPKPAKNVQNAQNAQNKPAFTTTETKLSGGNTVEVTVQPTKVNSPNSTKVNSPKPIGLVGKPIGKPAQIPARLKSPSNSPKPTNSQKPNGVKPNLAQQPKNNDTKINSTTVNTDKPQAKKRGRPAGSTNGEPKVKTPKKKILLAKSPKVENTVEKKVSPKKMGKPAHKKTPVAVKPKKELKEEAPSRISDRAASKVVYAELSDEDFDAAAFDKIAYETVDSFLVGSPQKVKMPKASTGAPPAKEVTISKKEFDRLKSIEKKYQNIQNICK